jgi:hypothetical protein
VVDKEQAQFNKDGNSPSKGRRAIEIKWNKGLKSAIHWCEPKLLTNHIMGVKKNISNIRLLTI